MPGLGRTDFQGALTALVETGYSGWLALECDEPGNNLVHASRYATDLQKSIALLKDSYSLSL